MTPSADTSPARATFGSRVGVFFTLVGVAVGLGNVWRFPYMVGKFGGAAFVVVYVLVVIAVGVPGLMAELALGRATHRGPVGAFSAVGMPGGAKIGWLFFIVVTMATAYYTQVVGWVLFFGLTEIVRPLGVVLEAARILPPDRGIAWRSLGLQSVFTALVIGSGAWVMARGVREGIQRASTIIMPALYVILLVLVARALTLPGAYAGVEWYILKFRVSDITAGVALAAMGQAIFSLSLGGTFMVVYGSYLAPSANVRSNAALTAIGDTVAGLLAGLAIIPAVFALGLAPTSGPSLLFVTLPQVFATIPVGWLFGALFFAGLFGAAWLSAIAALEVLVAGLTDNTRLTRRRAILLVSCLCWLAALPPSVNNAIFVPWDLVFGSGMQTLGALCAAVAFGWFVKRGDALAQLSSGGSAAPAWLVVWIRYGIPAAIASVGVWWLLTAVFKLATGV